MDATEGSVIREGADAHPRIEIQRVAMGSSSDGRLFWLDAARSAALLAMVVFHLFRDLEFFGVLPHGHTSQGGWAVAARTIAGSFILLSGISLVIAHENGFRFRSWVKRLVLISGAAALVSVATYAAFPERFIFFGILHCIALSGLLGTGLLRFPSWALWAIAALVIVAHGLWGGALFVSPWLAWTGLSSVVRPSLDFLPLVPWFAWFVLGMALAKGLPVTRWDVPDGIGSRFRSLAWAGKHSLAIYLIHQPLLIGILWVIFSGVV